MNKNLMYKIKVAVFTAIMVICLLFSGVVAGFKFCYPIGYTKEIALASSEFMIDESLVRAIIKVESGYNYKAVSKKGAVGLMQLMPQTAEWIAEALNEEYCEDCLYNPKQNIRYGCYYLRYLFDKFESLDKVLFAYNAGEGTLNKIIESGEPLNLLSVGISETSSYIKKVKKSYKIYNGLYIENK